MVEHSLFCIFFKSRNCNENHNLTNSQNFYGKFYFFLLQLHGKYMIFRNIMQRSTAMNCIQHIQSAKQVFQIYSATDSASCNWRLKSKYIDVSTTSTLAMTKTTTVHQTLIRWECLMIYLKKKKAVKKKKQPNNKNVLVKTIPEFTKFCLCHQSPTLRCILKGKGRRRFQTRSPWVKHWNIISFST